MTNGFIGTIGFIKGNLMCSSSTSEEINNDNFYPGAFIPKEYRYIFNNNSSGKFLVTLPTVINAKTTSIELVTLLRHSSIASVFTSPNTNTNQFNIVQRYNYGLNSTFWGGLRIEDNLPGLRWVKPSQPNVTELGNLTNWNIIKIDGPTKQVYQNNSLAYTFPTDFTVTHSPGPSTLQIPGYEGLGYIKIWENGKLIHYFYPTLDKDNKKCFYDKLGTGEFYYPNSQSNLYIGPLVQ